MPPWIPRSVFGAILASAYAVVAVIVVASERSPGGGGNWISLKGMATFLVTFPISVLGELIGMKPDFRRNADMILTICACAVLVYFLGAGLEKGARLLFWDGGAK